MKRLFALLALATMMSCADEIKRQEFLKSQFPNNKVEPATGLIQGTGFQFIMIDSTEQIIAVSFYPFSEKKIMELRNIR